MNLTIIVDSIPSERGRSIIARHLAHGPSISLKNAKQMVESTPFVYAEHLSKTDAARELANLKKLGCRVRLVRSDAASRQVGSPREESVPEERVVDPNAATTGDLVKSVRKEDDSSSATSDTGTEGHENAQLDSETHEEGRSEDGTRDPAPFLDQPDEDRKSDLPDHDFANMDLEGEVPEVESNSGLVAHDGHDPFPEQSASETSPGEIESDRERRLRSQSISRYTTSSSARKGNRRKQMVTLLTVVLCVAFPMLILVIIQEPADRRITQKNSILKQGQKSGRGTAGESTHSMHKKKIRPRSKVSKKQKQESSAYVDSASDAYGRYGMMIRFYTIALSFNPYNIQAWYGLIAALEDAGRNEEASKARKRMEELFGTEIFDVRKLVEPYGQLIDFSSRRKHCRVEYRATSATPEGLERDAYRLARAFRARDKCRELILHAETGLGSGMVTRIKLDPFPQTISQFRREAKILFAD